MVKTQFDIGAEVLGPIFYRFCHKLQMNQGFYPRDDSITLFLARGGLRLSMFYKHFLRSQGAAVMFDYSANFYASRFAVIKAALCNHFEEAIDELEKEFRWYIPMEALSLIVGSETFSAFQKECVDSGQEGLYREKSLRDILQISVVERRNKTLASYFKRQHAYLQEYFEQLTSGKENVLIVDTGWSGTIIGFLKILFPTVNIVGLFFGKYNYGQGPKVWSNDLVGLEVEGNDFTYLKPMTSVFLHRHIIEDVCEVNIPSVDGYHRDQESGEVFAYPAMATDKEIAPAEDEQIASGVLAYFINAEPQSPYTINKRAFKASKKLRRLICFPNNKEAELFLSVERSADFGKDVKAPLLIKPASIYQWRFKLRNILHSLWPAGQIALEFPVLHVFIQFLFLFLRRFNVAHRFVRQF